MTDYTTITNYSFSFSDHPTCPAFSTTLNNTGSEPFVKNIAVSLFTNTAKTTVATDIIPVLHAAIIDTVMISFTADQTIVAPISNSMLLFAYGGNPSRKFMLCSVGTITTAFNATVAANRHAVIIQLNIATVSVDPHNFTVMDFGGLSLTGPISHINVGTGPGVVGTAMYAAATVLTPAQVAAATAAAAAVTANAANQALVAQQAAAAAALATTLPTEINSSNLPPDTKIRL